jgi:hypothetical protein
MALFSVSEILNFIIAAVSLMAKLDCSFHSDKASEDELQPTKRRAKIDRE